MAGPWQNIPRRELFAHIELIEPFGPRLGRPHADTLKGSRHANMKELRFDAANGVWRFAYAFDRSVGPSPCAALTSRAPARSVSAGSESVI